MTGTILPDLASVATGKLRPLASAAFVQYLGPVSFVRPRRGLGVARLRGSIRVAAAASPPSTAAASPPSTAAASPRPD